VRPIERKADLSSAQWRFAFSHRKSLTSWQSMQLQMSRRILAKPSILGLPAEMDGSSRLLRLAAAPNFHEGSKCPDRETLLWLAIRINGEEKILKTAVEDP
jgi:hypothetical protein